MATWQARVDFDAASITDEQIDDIVEALAKHGITVGRTFAGRASAHLTVDTDDSNVDDAPAVPVRTVRKAVTDVGADFVLYGTEIIDDVEADRRYFEPTVPDLLTEADIARILKVSRQRVHQLAERPTFPKPVNPEGSTPLRAAAAVERFLEGWKRRTGRPARTKVVVDQESAPGLVTHAEVRAWLRSRRLAVPSRGRLPAELVERFEAETGEKVQR